MWVDIPSLLELLARGWPSSCCLKSDAVIVGKYVLLGLIKPVRALPARNLLLSSTSKPVQALEGSFQSCLGHTRLTYMVAQQPRSALLRLTHHQRESPLVSMLSLIDSTLRLGGQSCSCFTLRFSPSVLLVAFCTTCSSLSISYTRMIWFIAPACCLPLLEARYPPPLELSVGDDDNYYRSA